MSDEKKYIGYGYHGGVCEICGQPLAVDIGMILQEERHDRI